MRLPFPFQQESGYARLPFAALNFDLKSGTLLGESQECLPVEIQNSISDDPQVIYFTKVNLVRPPASALVSSPGPFPNFLGGAWGRG